MPLFSRRKHKAKDNSQHPDAKPNISSESADRGGFNTSDVPHNIGADRINTEGTPERQLPPLPTDHPEDTNAASDTDNMGNQQHQQYHQPDIQRTPMRTGTGLSVPQQPENHPELERHQFDNHSRQNESDRSRRNVQNIRSDQHTHEEIPVAAFRGLWSWIPFVPQSADDSTVVSRVRDVFVVAEQFVLNFYWDRPYLNNVSDECLVQVNASPRLSTPELQQHLNSAEFSLPLIKHVLISRLLSLIRFEEMSKDLSLLPKEFQNFAVLAGANANSTGGEEDVANLQPALSAFRVLSAYIRSDVEYDDNYRQDRRAIIDRIVDDFDAAFGYWAKDDAPAKIQIRSEKLVELLEMVGSLGIFLFSQPSVFHFNWHVSKEEDSSQKIPIWPRLLRVFDNNAQHRNPADHMIPMKFGVLDNETVRESGRPSRIDGNPTWKPPARAQTQASKNDGINYHQFVTDNSNYHSNNSTGAFRDRAETQHDQNPPPRPQKVHPNGLHNARGPQSNSGASLPYQSAPQNDRREFSDSDRFAEHGQQSMGQGHQHDSQQFSRRQHRDGPNAEAVSTPELMGSHPQTRHELGVHEGMMNISQGMGTTERKGIPEFVHEAPDHGATTTEFDTPTNVIGEHKSNTRSEPPDPDISGTTRAINESPDDESRGPELPQFESISTEGQR